MQIAIRREHTAYCSVLILSAITSGTLKFNSTFVKNTSKSSRRDDPLPSFTAVKTKSSRTPRRHRGESSVSFSVSPSNVNNLLKTPIHVAGDPSPRQIIPSITNTSASSPQLGETFVKVQFHKEKQVDY